MSPEEKFVFSAQQIINCGISPDSADNAVCPLFSTAHNNIIPLLQDARNENAMKKLCTARLNPMHYQRRTAAPSVGNVVIARSILGEFHNMVMTLDQLRDLVPEAVFHTPESASSLKAFDTLKSAACRSVTGEVSFASRCGTDELNLTIRALKTVDQFVTFTQQHPEISVSLLPEWTNRNFGYCAESTIKKELLEQGAQRHLWSIENNVSSAGRMLDVDSLGGPGPVRIIATVPMFQYTGRTLPRNIIFVIGGAKIKWTNTNCCYPVFLNTEFRRQCGSAFEALNHTMRLVIPSDPIAAGVAITDTHADHHIDPLHLLIGGQSVTLTHFC
jgi:hypothetical protein